MKVPSVRGGSPDFNRFTDTPVDAVRSTRHHDIRVMTSMKAGKMTALAAIPLLREDHMTRASVRFSFESMETAEILMNPVVVTVKAYLVPNLAFDWRFNGMDSLNRSYKGIPEKDGDPVIPYFETGVAGAWGSHEIHKYMGKHAKPGQLMNLGYQHAYNLIWNFRARNRSPKITPRLMSATSLAPAFWQHSQFKHIVPDFDQAIIDGEIALNLATERLNIKGIYGLPSQAGTPASIPATAVDTSGVAIGANTRRGSQHSVVGDFTTSTQGNHLWFDRESFAPYAPRIYAELEGAGVTLSMSNLELAKKTQAWAEIRTKYNGIDEEYIIDLLMDGLSVPEQAWRQPMLLGDSSVKFGQAKRYATDSGNLDESAVDGATFIDMTVRAPQCGTGGIIMFIAEILPEQLFERTEDPYLNALVPDVLPQFLRDTLDPEKVEVVQNKRIDVQHAQPTETFGYEPLNARWNYAHVCVGGKFHRPDPAAGFNQDRNRLWAVETLNPRLTEDFFLATNIHTKPFNDQVNDPFECVALGDALISGLTVFGPALIENRDDYDKVLAKAPNDRIVKP